MATLSTHVLDNGRGKPAAGIVIELHAVRDGARHHLSTAVTNDDGRLNTPLSSSPLASGVYELTFHAGDYLRANGLTLPDPPFLDEIVIRFGIGDASAHYHVPLLLSTYGYSTYRGS